MTEGLAVLIIANVANAMKTIKAVTEAVHRACWSMAKKPLKAVTANKGKC